MQVYELASGPPGSGWLVEPPPVCAAGGPGGPGPGWGWPPIGTVPVHRMVPRVGAHHLDLGGYKAGCGPAGPAGPGLTGRLTL